MSTLKFNVNEILPALTKVASVVNPKNSIPILGYIMVETIEGNRVRLTSSDSDLWLQANANIIDASDDIKFCVETKTFLQTLRNLKNLEVTIELDGRNLIGTYKNGSFSIPFESTETYPLMPLQQDQKVMNIDSYHLLNAILMTFSAVGNDELRPILNGIHFNFFKDKLVSVATDGRKLSKLTDLSIVKDDDEVVGFTMSKKTCNILRGIISEEEDLEVKYNDSSICVNSEYFTLTSRLIEGVYPNYDRVIPKDNDKNVIIKKNELLESLKRIMPLGESQTNFVVFELNENVLQVQCENTAFSTSAKESIPCKYSGEHFSIGFCGSDVFNSVSNIDSDEILIQFKAPETAAIVVPLENAANIGFISLLMPIRIIV